MKTDITTLKGFIDFVYDFYNTMKDHQVSLVYEGIITHDIVKAFSALTEANMEKHEENAGTQKKVFHVMVECLQNISKHSDYFEDEKVGRGVFIVSKAQDHYMLTTGNIVDKDKVPKLTEMLEHVNTLDKDGLKELYKTQMMNGSLSDRGGAGLGFISIARKTGSKLGYSFQPVGDDKAFFILSSVINRNSL